MTDPFPPRDVQLEVPPGVIDFRWGHPAASLLPAAQLAQAAERALAKGDVAALSYGRVGGPASLIEPLTDWLARHDDPSPHRQSVIHYGGNLAGSGSPVHAFL